MYATKKKNPTTSETQKHSNVPFALQYKRDLIAIELSGAHNDDNDDDKGKKN